MSEGIERHVNHDLLLQVELVYDGLMLGGSSTLFERVMAEVGAQDSKVCKGDVFRAAIVCNGEDAEDLLAALKKGMSPAFYVSEAERQDIIEAEEARIGEAHETVLAWLMSTKKETGANLTPAVLDAMKLEIDALVMDRNYFYGQYQTLLNKVSGALEVLIGDEDALVGGEEE